MRTAEVRIGLPSGAGDGVAVEPGDRRVVIELPRGAEYPLEFAAPSGDLVRSGEVTPLEGGRRRLELILATGYLARVAIDAGDLVLTFESRLERSRAAAEGSDTYALGPEDKIALTVHNHPDLSSELTVSQDGTITAPLVGEVRAAGISPRELSARLAEMLGRNFLVDPQVDVAVTEYRSQWVMVTGEVPLAGRIPLRGGTRLKEVLSEAGGFRDTSGQEIVISRRSEDQDKYETIRISRSEFESGARNPLLQPGDIVEVARASYCYIQGEVRSPGRVPIEPGITLLKAITLVGGLTEWADQKAVQVLYGDDRESGGRVYNLKKIRNRKAEDPVLRGDEVIVVKRRFF